MRPWPSLISAVFSRFSSLSESFPSMERKKLISWSFSSRDSWSSPIFSSMWPRKSFIPSYLHNLRWTASSSWVPVNSQLHQKTISLHATKLLHNKSYDWLYDWLYSVLHCIGHISAATQQFFFHANKLKSLCAGPTF